jgi:MFS family permease
VGERASPCWTPPAPARHDSQIAASRFFVDLTPLRISPDYRRLYTGQAISFLGRQLTLVAAPIQAYDLTGSSVTVGLLGLAQLPPLLVGSLLGGSLADAYDRRRLMLIAQVVLLTCSVGLALNAQHGYGHLWPLYLLTAAQAGLSGIDSPTRNAATPGLVGDENITAAAALNQILYQVGGVTGPAVAGILIARVGLAAAYWCDVACFVLAIVQLLRLRPLPPEGGGRRAGMASVVEGLRFLRGRKALQGTFVIDVNAMVFGMPKALFPALGETVFGGGAQTVGLLYAAPGVGALIGAVASGWTNRVRRPGRAVLWAVVVWGAATAGFAITASLPVALVLLAIAGAGDVVSAVFRNTILLLSVPDNLRGRLSAVHIAVVTGGPRLGDAESGGVAGALGPQLSAVTGGLACIVGVAVIAVLMPELGRWTHAQAAAELAELHAAAGSAGDGPDPAGIDPVGMEPVGIDATTNAPGEDDARDDCTR